jgi:hypothetical protein
VDRIEWTDYNDGVHLLASYSMSTVTGLTLQRYAGLKKWEAAALGALTGTFFGFTKEVFFDRYTSRTDLKMWAAGGAAGGLTILVLDF